MQQQWRYTHHMQRRGRRTLEKQWICWYSKPPPFTKPVASFLFLFPRHCKVGALKCNNDLIGLHKISLIAFCFQQVGTMCECAAVGIKQPLPLGACPLPPQTCRYTPTLYMCTLHICASVHLFCISKHLYHVVHTHIYAP